MVLRLIVRGPKDFDDHELVREILDRLTAKADDVVLISDLPLDRETSIESSFPPAEKWFRLKWMANSKSGGDQRKFSTVIRYHAPYNGEKKWSKGKRIQRLEMLRDATAIVAFWAVGEGDYDTEEFIRLAKLMDIKLRVVNI